MKFNLEAAIEISGVHINYLIPIQKKIIQYLFDNEPWTKVGQSLVYVNQKAYDKIEVVRLLLEDGKTKRYEFWFDISKCYGKFSNLMQHLNIMKSMKKSKNSSMTITLHSIM